MACLALAAAVAVVPAGCALQSDVMEMEGQVAGIQALQKQLEQGVADAKDAAETMRAVNFRMEALENKLNERSDTALEARITKGIDDLQNALDAVAAERKATEGRMREAETFFTGRLERVSARQQGIENRLTDLEGDTAPSPELRASRAEMAADLQTLRQRLAAQDEALKAVQGQFGLVTDRLAQLAAAQAAMPEPGLDPQGAERLGMRLSNVETQAADAAQARQRLVDQLALMTDNLAKVNQAQQASETQQAALAEDAAGALQTRLAALERKDAERARLEQGLAEQIGHLDGRLAGVAGAQEQAAQETRTRTEADRQARAALAEDTAGKLEVRLAALEQKDARRVRAEQEMADRIAALTDRLGRLSEAGDKARTDAQARQASLSEQAAADLAKRLTALEAGENQAADARRRLEEATQALATRLGTVSNAQTAQANQVAANVEDAGRIAVRLDALEKGGVDAAETRRRLASELGRLADRLVAVEGGAAATDQLQAAVNGLDARLAAMEGAGGRVQRLAELTDQLSVLGQQVTQRLDAQATDFVRLAARIDRMESGVEAFQDAPPEWGKALDQKVTFLADQITPRVDTQSKELTALASTLAATRDQADQREAAFSDRLNTLGTSLVRRVDTLEGRVADVEKVPPGTAAPDPDVNARLESLGRQVDVLGGKLPGQVDTLTDLVAQLRVHLDRVGERITLLETIQKQDSADLRERFNALSAALGELSAGRGGQ